MVFRIPNAPNGFFGTNQKGLLQKITYCQNHEKSLRNHVKQIGTIAPRKIKITVVDSGMGFFLHLHKILWHTVPRVAPVQSMRTTLTKSS